MFCFSLSKVKSEISFPLSSAFSTRYKWTLSWASIIVFDVFFRIDTLILFLLTVFLTTTFCYCFNILLGLILLEFPLASNSSVIVLLAVVCLWNFLFFSIQQVLIFFSLLVRRICCFCIVTVRVTIPVSFGTRILKEKSSLTALFLFNIFIP